MERSGRMKVAISPSFVVLRTRLVAAGSERWDMYRTETETRVKRTEGSERVYGETTKATRL